MNTALASAARQTVETEYKKLIESANSFNKLAAASSLPGPIKLRLRPIVRQVRTALGDYDEARVELCKSLGTWNEDAKEYKFGDRMDDFTAELKALQKGKTDLNLRPISIAEAPEILAILTAAELDDLDWLLQFDEESEQAVLREEQDISAVQ